MALGRAFHKVGAARENDRSPKVLRVLSLGRSSRHGSEWVLRL